MPDAVKARDLQRDPRYALHTGSTDPPDWGGDAKLAGRAEELTDPDRRLAMFRTRGADPPSEDSHLFRLDILEASVVALNPAGDRLVIEVWRPGNRSGAWSGRDDTGRGRRMHRASADRGRDRPGPGPRAPEGCSRRSRRLGARPRRRRRGERSRSPRGHRGSGRPRTVGGAGRAALPGRRPPLSPSRLRGWTPPGSTSSTGCTRT